MVRAYTPADIIQSVPGSAAAQQTINPALTNPAGSGHCGVLLICATSVVNPPEQWHTAASVGAGGLVTQSGVLCRADLPENDQSWALSFGGVGNWLWIVEEWDNVSFAPLVATTPWANVSGSVESLDSGSTGTWDAPYVVGVAVCGVIGGPSATSGWSPITWSNGFVETNVETLGAGQDSGGLRLHVARRYGTLNETGPWSTTVTWTDGVQTAKTQMLSIAVFRAENYAGDI